MKEIFYRRYNLKTLTIGLKKNHQIDLEKIIQIPYRALIRP